VPEPEEDGVRDLSLMASALACVADQPPPSRHAPPGLLEGLPNVIERSRRWLGAAAKNPHP
jgi:hypothetical protein